MVSSLDAEEVAKFEAMALEWWDPHGKFKPLHKMNPCRLEYICGQIAWHFKRDRQNNMPFENLDIVDVGCGGGLLSEPMARLGANITGVDAAKTNIKVAKLHAERQGLNINYQNQLAEGLAASGAQYDVVIAMEIIEHVANPQEFINTLFTLLRPGGMMVMSTLNRNTKSYAFAILGAEHILRWLPVGTHDWNKFITPDELTAMAQNASFTLQDSAGMVFNLLTQNWSTSHKDLSVNYAITALRAVETNS